MCASLCFCRWMCVFMHVCLMYVFATWNQEIWEGRKNLSTGTAAMSANTLLSDTSLPVLSHLLVWVRRAGKFWCPPVCWGSPSAVYRGFKASLVSPASCSCLSTVCSWIEPIKALPSLLWMPVVIEMAWRLQGQTLDCRKNPIQLFSSRGVCT